MDDFTWMIGGEAGFGIMTTGLTFSKIATRSGYHIFDYVEYPSLIRGGHNAYEVHVADREIRHLAPVINILVCLNKETFNKHKDRLSPESYVVFDPDDFTPEGNFKKISVPIKKTLTDLKGQAVMKNMIALSASLAVAGGDLALLTDMIEKEFARKGEEVVTFNKKFAEIGYSHVKTSYPDVKSWLTKTQNPTPQLVLTGNDAFSLSSIVADSRFYSAYPMTPSSSVLTTLAAWADRTGMVVRHAEDEISVINTALGASWAGVRSAVGTSGGGFALMVETVSLSGVTEIPIVIFLSQRPGPATGMPTWTEQGDLLFAVHAGHGEFPKIVLAPGTVEEMIELAARAFNLADVYQTPVIVMSDMYLSEGHKSVSKKFIDDFIAGYKVNRGKTIDKVDGDKYLRYQLTEDGISPRLIPGVPGHFYQANSYEHLEDGHSTEEAAPRVAQVDKRAKKLKTYLERDFKSPEISGDQTSAEIIFVSWGSNKGAILEAQRQLKEKGRQSAFIHFSYVYPLAREKITALFRKDKNYVLVENNSTGQFGTLLRSETGIEINKKIFRYDGRPITAEYIISNLK